jgi:hypothetical protein
MNYWKNRPILNILMPGRLRKQLVFSMNTGGSKIVAGGIDLLGLMKNKIALKPLSILRISLI